MKKKKILVLNRKDTAIAGIVLFGLVTVAATSPANDKYTNLKVLPKNISSLELSRIMVDEFSDGLGVSCTFCHAEDKDSHKPDYASDEKPEKLIARKMMRMTIAINRKYFQLKHPSLSGQLVTTCNTCHNGQAHP